MFYYGLVLCNRNTHHIEPGVAVVQAMLGDKKLRRLRHFLLFPRVNRFQRNSKAMIRAGLYFDEHDDAAVQNDKVHLSHRTAVVSLHDSIALLCQIQLRDPLPFTPKNLLLISHG